MTRIIGGSAKGRRISTPPGDATRPTSDRVREALFSSVEARFGTLRGLRVLDLYAGSGAVGLEAMSRGAAAATLVESDRSTAALISKNARDLGLDVEVVAQPVARVLSSPPAEPFDVVFADPPYPLADADLAAALALLVDNGWLVADAVVVVERSRRSLEPGWPAGLGATGVKKKYGETVLWYVRRADGDE